MTSVVLPTSDPLVNCYWLMGQMDQAAAQRRIEQEATHDFAAWGYTEMMVLNKNMDHSAFWDQVAHDWYRWYSENAR